MADLDRELLRRVVAAALDEDLGERGDITTAAVIPDTTRGTGRVVGREEFWLAGLPVAREVFLALDETLEFTEHRKDGERIAAGERVATVRGAAAPILRGERTALNFLMRMSGIATAARAAVEEIAGTGARILDTRKTAPGLRRLDKYAVAIGGATNHRMGLHDAAMIKDTHLGVAPSIREAVARVLRRGHPPDAITVEVGSVEQLEQAIEAGAGRALLDNMDLETMREAVRRAAGRIVLEASGGLRPGNLRAVAETGVDFLSLGWLTHSARAADLALEMDLDA
jgi:nicotinate-nucleotide pyrophosphorylase (carboxylating)